MRCLLYILLFIALSPILYAQTFKSAMEAMSSTFNFQGDTSGAGTCFMVNVDSKQYFVTAAHLFKTTHKSGDIVPIQILIQNQLRSFDAQVYFHTDKNVDIVMMKLPEEVSQGGKGISLDSKFVPFGQDVFFFGFPLTNLGTEAFGMKLPLVKKATISGQVKYLGVDVLVLDGHNNRGFSGGPVAGYDTTGDKLFVIGVISGYFFEPRSVQFKGEKLSFDENSGIILCYGRQYIDEILKNVLRPPKL